MDYLPQPGPTPIAVPVRIAAQMVGVSRPQFFKEWVWSGRIKTYELGGRGSSVLVADLDAAVKAQINKQIEDPNFRRPIPVPHAPGKPGKNWKKRRGKAPRATR